MPNWVFNSIYINGNPEDAKEFFAKAKAKYTESYYDWEDNSQRVLRSKEVSLDFGFRSFVQPPSENYDDELTEAGGLIQSWYHWNIDNWGTKWDAHDVYVDPENMHISFSSAWSPPMPVFEAIVKQFPNLSFTFRYEEEQGWGGEIHAKDGVITYKAEWDIPNSHAEEKGLGRDCVCDYDDDQTYWYSDCPREEELANA